MIRESWQAVGLILYTRHYICTRLAPGQIGGVIVTLSIRAFCIAFVLCSTVQEEYAWRQADGSREADDISYNLRTPAPVPAHPKLFCTDRVFRSNIVLGRQCFLEEWANWGE